MLRLIKDQNGNIRKRYRYNDPTRSEMVTTLTVQGLPISGISIPIKATPNPQTYGATTYTWNFGDGTTLTTSTPLVNKTFAAGTYFVQVTVSNPEYGSSSAGQVITVINQP